MNNEQKPQGLGREQMAAILNAQQATSKADEWQGELGSLRQAYPSLDIENGLKSPKLKELLRAGVDFKTAYEVANFEDIARHIVADTEKRVLEKIETNAARTTENGIAASKTAPFSAGSQSMTKDDRDAIIKRVLRGEQVTL